MKPSRYILTLFALLSFQNCRAQGPPVCLPVFTTPPTINGIVATDPFHLMAGVVPNADIAWATAPYEEFCVVNGVCNPTTLKAAIFAGTSLVGGKPDHLYMGVHVEGADQFSAKDIVTIYVDSNGSGTPGSPKPNFALSYNIGPNTPPVAGQNANSQPVTSANLYMFQGGAWGNPTIPPINQVNSLTAYNFPAVGTGIWELEIDINLTAMGVPTSATGLQFGAKLYVAHPTLSPTPFDWPKDMIKDLNPNNSAPGAATAGGPDPAIVDMRTINPGGQTCSGDVQFLPNSLSSHVKGLDNYFYRPKDGGPPPPNNTTNDFSGDLTLPPNLQTQLTANVIYVNTADTGNTSFTGGTNTGRVHFYLFPWGAGPVTTVDAGFAPVGFQQFGTPIAATVSWPPDKPTWEPFKDAFWNPALSDHVCLQAKIENFLQDSIPANDTTPQINLSYTTMSTHRDKFLIHALGTPTPGAPKDEYLLHLHWDNLSKGQTKDVDHECWLRRLCDWFHHRKYWRAHFVNPSALGLKSLGKGYYSLQLAPGQEVTAELEMSGAVMPVPSQVIHVSPRAGGQILSPASGDPAVVVPIPDGGMVTVIANGLISVLPQDARAAVAVGARLTNANGFSAPRLVEAKFLLSSKAVAPWQVTGALIGAFSPDFSDSFFIGTQGTFYAAPGATKLYLAVNYVAGQYGDNSGAGFDLNVVATPPPPLPTKLSWPANPKLGLPGRPQPAANLPLLAVDVMKVDKANKATIPVGYVSYGVYATHAGNAGHTTGTKPGVRAQKQQ